MNSRSQWGIIVSACVAAALIIGATLYFTVSSEPEKNTGALAAEAVSGSDAEDRLGDWRRALEAIASTTASKIGDYRAPKELPKTQGVSQELVATYLALKSENKLGTEEASDSIQDLITRNIAKIEPKDTYTVSSLKTSSSVTLDSYAGSLGDAMQKSSAVREYELVTFARAVGLEITSGMPELKVAAGIYRSIERDLLNAPVPTAIAQQHLELLKAVAYLAHTTELMSAWSGDPLDGLAYIDGFVNAERRVRTALNSLFAAMVEFGKQS